MSKLEPILSEKNGHERDKYLMFDEPSHKYTITNDLTSVYTSVTTWNHSHFPHFNADKVIEKMMKGKNWHSENKYWGMSSEEIKEQWSKNAKEVSGAGTALHFDIECFMNQNVKKRYTHESLLESYNKRINEGEKPPNESIEWDFFLNYVKKYPLQVPYRTEWMIYDEELKLAGSIDMVYENQDGSLSIYDWKRSKDISKINNFGESATTECVEHLPNTNYWHYSLQLNTYKAILEKKYDKKVKDLWLVKLHPTNTNNSYELLRCADLQSEVFELFQRRKNELNK